MNLRPYQEDLINEVRAAYRSGYHAPCVVAPCGAGKSVIISKIAKMTTDRGKNVLFLVHRQELKEQIESSFQRMGVNMKLCTLGMVQTICRRLGKMPDPDLIITDENHHGLAASYRKIFDYYEGVLRLGFTATPIRLSGAGLKDINDILVYGPTAKWLIENSYLAPYKYYAPEVVKTGGLKIVRGDYKTSDMDKLFDKAIYGDVINHYKKLADGKQAICYCVSINKSKETAEAFNDAGISAVHFDAKTPKLERKRIIKDFREGKIKVLCNVDLIGEGFDVPDCEVVILLRPTASLSLYIQQSMRSMRYKPDKIAIIIDHVGNVGRFGLPDMEREWTLDGESKKERKSKKQTAKTCPNCFAVIPIAEKPCHYCGYEFIAEERQVEEKPAEELAEIDEKSFVLTLDYREPKDCKTLEELQRLAKSRGYKPGWAYYQAKLLNIM